MVLQSFPDQIFIPSPSLFEKCSEILNFFALKMLFSEEFYTSNDEPEYGLSQILFTV